MTSHTQKVWAEAQPQFAVLHTDHTTDDVYVNGPYATRQQAQARAADLADEALAAWRKIDSRWTIEASEDGNNVEIVIPEGEEDEWENGNSFDVFTMIP